MVPRIPRVPSQCPLKCVSVSMSAYSRTNAAQSCGSCCGVKADGILETQIIWKHSELFTAAAATLVLFKPPTSRRYIALKPLRWTRSRLQDLSIVLICLHLKVRSHSVLVFAWPRLALPLPDLRSLILEWLLAPTIYMACLPLFDVVAASACVENGFTCSVTWINWIYQLILVFPRSTCYYHLKSISVWWLKRAFCILHRKKGLISLVSTS